MLKIFKAKIVMIILHIWIISILVLGNDIVSRTQINKHNSKCTVAVVSVLLLSLEILAVIYCPVLALKFKKYD